MTAMLVSAWLGLAGLVAWDRRPLPERSRADGPAAATGVSRVAVGQFRVVDELGRRMLERVPVLHPASPRAVGAALLATATLVLVSGPPAVVVGAGALAVARTLARRRSVRRSERDLRDVATIVDLVAVAVASGLDPPAALAAVASARRAGGDAGLGAALAPLDRGGSFGDALDEWAGTGTAAAELVGVLRSAESSGAAVVEALERLARDLRRRRRRSAEQRARRLPVTTLFPLVVCILPAFALLTVVPMVAVGLSRVLAT